ncbi:molybdopterin-dependent oxidoreductase [Micromonospora endolithica]|uniref:Molybdopterin-binding oxidoreductase n=1 Tax=Micromonospora endolithica TaxID=230091 RepID=A0A3A9YS38_9ACTN|nr:molybdopterin-dependent oxidoreductase [Micromonospora endolithica]RKN38629.1 molybdopterin-binding oxidoreductase [Micromonospora endolithica]TWJ25237.1 DMSO/TMAO reductase YedYZ molybdopterin-dependent catalytic subunit [Micromonospora endolithica]
MEPTDIEPRPATRRPGPPRPGTVVRAVAVGLCTAAVTLGVSHLGAAVVDPAADPVLAVGAASIDLAPQPLKAFAIRTFGTNDKIVLLGGVYTVLVLAAVALGAAALRRRRFGLVGLVAFTGVGAVAVLSRPTATAVDVLPVLAGAGAGVVAMLLVVRAARTVTSAATGRPRLLNRRQFLATAGGTAVGAAAVTTAGQAIARSRPVGAESRASVSLPPPVRPAPPLPATVSVGVDGMPPFVTPNRDFYRVDTALIVPQVDLTDWRLTLDGAVDRPRTWRYEDLLARGLVERDITLNCVSNEVGGPYIGTARWTGIPLAPLLREAGLRPGQNQLVSRSVEGMTIGTPLEAILDGRDALLAVGMNGEPLPLDHGFPLRMLVPGLYGYVGACKWLTSMTVTTFDAFDPYWVQRGWAPDAPVKTASRIDTPKPFAQRPAGPVMIAGVAWAQRRGITAVEVQVDDGPWQQARLADGPSPDLWRQWTYRWDATPGSHTLRVRATDATGATQTAQRVPPFPDGATGWHSVTVTIT